MSCLPPMLKPSNRSKGGGGGGSVAGTICLSKEAFAGTYYNVRLVYETDEYGRLRIKESSSYISGLTYGWEYTHHTSYTRISADNTVSFEVDGTTSINVDIGGIGTVSTRSTLLKGSYNPCTGRGGIEKILESYQDNQN
ncbi:hypothetical protein ACJRPK_04530 [Aquimarina sp. 2-A2]|uniref:hypothetical protein n=1 Tax=Aquimarina sp. 2-A2 TaxID=3382644 RepID=UPI00387EFB0D